MSTEFYLLISSLICFFFGVSLAIYHTFKKAEAPQDPCITVKDGVFTIHKSGKYQITYSTKDNE